MLDKYFPLYAAVFLLSLLATALLEKKLIPLLSGRAAQPIYKEGPAWHIKKSGTPTMGGLAFLISVFALLLLSSLFLHFSGKDQESVSLAIAIIYSALNACVGIFDDRKKLKEKRNEGLTPRQKLFFQSIFAAMFLVARALLLGDKTSIAFSFGELELGLLYYPLAFIILLGIVNCANLTDGIDGLASGVAFSVGVVMFYISASLYSDVAFLSSAIMGAAVGFLFFNIHPAKIFMGDTGSLFLGALAVSSAFSLGNPLIIIFIGGVYVVEGISVIIQVIFYKLTGRRIFKMAPLHHHLERCGMSETKICMIAIIFTFILSLPAFILYLP